MVDAADPDVPSGVAAGDGGAAPAEVPEVPSGVLTRSQRECTDAAAAGDLTRLKLRGLTSEHVWDYENGFYWFTDSRRLGKLLSHYEIYKKIVSLPGHVVECGVYKGASMIRWATFRDVTESKFSRKIIGFDAFGPFPTSSLRHEDDVTFTERFEAAGGEGITLDEARTIFQHKNMYENIDFIQGDVHQTIPRWLEENTQGRIALLHLDMDVYEPTKIALENLWSRVVRGGVVVIDDYNSVGGATRAVDEFLADKNIILQKHGVCHVPCFFVKP